MKLRKPELSWVALLLILFLTGCSSTPESYTEGRELLAKGQWEGGLGKVEQAARDAPANLEIRSVLMNQKLQTTQSLLNSADNARLSGLYEEAETSYRTVLRLEPANPRAIHGLEQIYLDRQHSTQAKEADALLAKGQVDSAERLLRTILAQDPGHPEARRLLGLVAQKQANAENLPAALKSTLDKNTALEFRDAPLKSVFEVLARSYGINFVFDKDVKTDAKITIFVRKSSLGEVIRLILATQQLDSKLLNENSILIYPGNPAKTKEYQELVVKTFYLANTDVKQAQALVKAVVKSRDTFVDEKLNLLIIKDTPEAVRLAERLIESLDLAEPEVMLDVEVLEISRRRLLDLGMQFPDQVGYGLLQPSTSSAVISGGELAAGNIDLRSRSGLTTYIANPALIMKLKEQDGDSNILANPRIRVRNNQKAKVHIGERLPVFTTTSTANVGVSAGVSYLDTGLKLEVQPQVYLDSSVGIQVGLEVSNVVKEVSGPQGSIAYAVGTRNAETSLRLKNGETQILAGLINTEESVTSNKLPGLGDIPILGQIFSDRRNTNNKTEIVLLITPRVIRTVARPELVAPVIASGTESSVGAKPLLISAEPNSLSLSGRPAPGSQELVPPIDVGTVPSPERAPLASEVSPPQTPAVTVQPAVIPPTAPSLEMREMPLPEIPPPILPPPGVPPSGQGGG